LTTKMCSTGCRSSVSPNNKVILGNKFRKFPKFTFFALDAGLSSSSVARRRNPSPSPSSVSASSSDVHKRAAAAAQPKFGESGFMTVFQRYTYSQHSTRCRIATCRSANVGAGGPLAPQSSPGWSTSATSGDHKCPVAGCFSPSPPARRAAWSRKVPIRVPSGSAPDSTAPASATGRPDQREQLRQHPGRAVSHAQFW